MVTVEEYLHTSYRPDCDYVDGKVLERNSCLRDHSMAQRNLMLCLVSRYPDSLDRVLPEQRMQVSETRFRIADMCVLREDAPEEQTLRTPPELCVEVLSSEDTLTGIMDRLKDYLQMGVPICWIVDPQNREAGTATTPGRLDKVVDGMLRAGTIEWRLMKSSSRRRAADFTYLLPGTTFPE